jgi:hypothetical protein
MIWDCFRRSPRRYEFYNFHAPAARGKEAGKPQNMRYSGDRAAPLRCRPVAGRAGSRLRHAISSRSRRRRLVDCVAAPHADHGRRVQGRPRRRLGDDACVGLGYAVAALVNYGIAAARRAAWSCSGGGSSKQSSSMALGDRLVVRLVCKRCLAPAPKPVFQGRRYRLLLIYTVPIRGPRSRHV